MCKEQLENVLLSALDFSFTECPSSPHTQKHVILKLLSVIYEKLLQLHEVTRDKKGYIYITFLKRQQGLPVEWQASQPYLSPL